MRPFGLTLVLLGAASAVAQPAEREPAPPPRIQSAGGITVIRGSTSQTPPPRTDGAAAAQKDAAETKPETAKAPRVVRSSGSSLDANGRQRQGSVTETVQRDNGASARTLTLRNLNGRSVPYITEKEKRVGAPGGAGATERRIQRYDDGGRPSQQELIRTEERKLPGGGVEVTETLYREDLNGRMRMVERTVATTTEKGPVKTISKQTEKPSISGGFEPVLREESVETRQGEGQATMRTVRSARLGGGLEVVSREESTMSKQGSVATTETKVFERQPVSGELALSKRSVGRLEEAADGTVVERVETYGFQLAGGATNVNVTRPALQQVLERRQVVEADGSVREKILVRGLDGANSGRMGAPTVTETVTKPTADGAEVRTEVYEQSVNGRLRPAQVTVERIEK